MILNKYTRRCLPAAVLLFAACGSEEGPEPQAGAVPQVSISDVPPPASRAAAEDTMFQDLDGNPLSLADFAGRKVFLNYWATWCAPCIREIPSIARAEDVLADEGYVFLLASDESLEQINGFLQERGFEGNFIKLNGYFGAHGVDAVPSTVLYDENGEELNTWLGSYEWDSEEMLAELRGAGTD